MKHDARRLLAALIILSGVSAWGPVGALRALSVTTSAVPASAQPSASRVDARQIRVGDVITDALVVHGDGVLYELTAPSDGMLVVQVRWEPWRGHVELWSGDTPLFDLSPDRSTLVASFPVVAGQKYSFGVYDGAPWDYDDLFLPFKLTTTVVGSSTIERPRPAISIAADPAASPIAPNTPVQLTVTPTSDTPQLEYLFWLWRQGTGWTRLHEYSPVDTITWTPTEPGTYNIQVWARRIGSNEAFDAWNAVGVILVSARDPIRVSSVSQDKRAPGAGQPVTFTAVAAGGTNGPLQYQFWRQDSGDRIWKMVQDYSASRTYTWTPGTADVGWHIVQVLVHSAGSSAITESGPSNPPFEVLPKPRIAVFLDYDVDLPVPPNTPIDFTVHASGGLEPYEYKFWVLKVGEGWTLARDYDTSNTFRWTPSSGGQYTVQLWVRNAGSTAAYDEVINYSALPIGPSGPARITSFTSNRMLPADAGTTVTWTAVGTGGTAGPLQYQFWRLDQSTGVWTVVQDYSSENTFTWTTIAGAYLMQVHVKSAVAGTLEGWGSTGYFTIW